jgi:hypothetical protein
MVGPADLNPGDRWAVPLVQAGYVLGPDELGKLTWTPNRPDLFNGAQSWYDQGCYVNAGTANTTEFMVNLSGGTRSNGIGSGRPQGSAILNTGTGAAGRIAFVLTQTCIQLSTTSGLWVAEILVRIPTLDNGTDKYLFNFGFFDTNTAVAQVDGISVVYDKTTQGNNFKFVTTANSTATTTDTGVTVAAGVYYRIKVTVTNNTTASCFIVADASGVQYGAAVATQTTNIPTGAGREFGGGVNLLKEGGTTSRTVEYVYMHVYREPARTAGAIAVDGGLLSNGLGDGIGMPTPGLGQMLGVNAAGQPVWLERRRRPELNVPLLTIDVNQGQEYGATASGTSAAVTAAPTGIAGQPQMIQFTTGTTTTGMALKSGFTWGSTGPVSFGPTTGGGNVGGVFVYECIFSVPTLSGATDTHQFVAGWFSGNSLTAPGDGVYVQIDTNTDVHLQCKTKAAGTGSTTTTTTTLTIAAATFYWVRIVVRPDTTAPSTTVVDFYAAALGSSLGAALASHTTNIPGDVNVAGLGIGPAAGLQKSAGTTAATANVIYQTSYQRLAA